MIFGTLRWFMCRSARFMLSLAGFILVWDSCVVLVLLLQPCIHACLNHRYCALCDSFFLLCDVRFTPKALLPDISPLFLEKSVPVAFGEIVIDVKLSRCAFSQVPKSLKKFYKDLFLKCPYRHQTNNLIVMFFWSPVEVWLFYHSSAVNLVLQKLNLLYRVQVIAFVLNYGSSGLGSGVFEIIPKWWTWQSPLHRFCHSNPFFPW